MNKARRYWERRWQLACATALGATLMGCEPSNTVSSGAPVMVSFGPIGADGTALTLVDDAGKPLPTPPLTRFQALFDRLPDPTTLENLDGTPKAGLALVQAPVAAPAGIASTTLYVPNGDRTFTLFLFPGPSITVSPTCGLPSGAAVTVTLDLQKVRSHDMKTPAVAAADASPVLSFTTEPLGFLTDPPQMLDMMTQLPIVPEIDAGQVVTMTFNNRVPGFQASADAPDPCATMLPSTLNHIHVAATLGGVPVSDLDVVVAPDAADATKWTVSPPGTTADEPGKWPPGATITITADAMATDIFAQPLGTEASASFKVKS